MSWRMGRGKWGQDRLGLFRNYLFRVECGVVQEPLRASKKGVDVVNRSCSK